MFFSDTVFLRFEARGLYFESTVTHPACIRGRLILKAQNRIPKARLILFHVLINPASIRGQAFIRGQASNQRKTVSTFSSLRWRQRLQTLLCAAKEGQFHYILWIVCILYEGKSKIISILILTFYGTNCKGHSCNWFFLCYRLNLIWYLAVSYTHLTLPTILLV